MPEAEAPCRRQLAQEVSQNKRFRTRKLLDEKENVTVANGETTGDVTDLC